MQPNVSAKSPEAGRIARRLLNAFLIVITAINFLLIFAPGFLFGRSDEHLFRGTGFFISNEGILLTANHVVRGCSRLNIESETIPRMSAAVLATNDGADIALLRVTDRLPGPTRRLAISTILARPADSLKVYGYFATNTLRASVAEVTLSNDLVPQNLATGDLRIPGIALWLDGALAPGASGAPVINQSGEVDGVVSGETKDPGVKFGLAIGPLWLLKLMTNVAELGNPPAKFDASIQDEAIRAAIVRVLCWREVEEK